MMAVERLDKAELLRLAQATGLADAAWPDSFAAIGNPQLLTATKTAVLCSRQCPGEVILRLFDLARRLRASDLTFIGGFHTPAERDFMHHLLPGSCRLIICPARSLEGMRVPAAWRKAMEAGRLLLLSPFASASQRRQAARLAERRNELVLALADQILLLHAAPDSHTASLVQNASLRGVRTLTLASDDESLCQQLAAAPTGGAEL
jgi:predicted Rossmann fold nucleotide-binding protein DprA/Smf involved in DNA uptake